MPITEKTVFVVNGMRFDTLEEAQDQERFSSIVDDLRTRHDVRDGGQLRETFALAVASNAAMILDVLKRHLEPAPRADDFIGTLNFAEPIDEGAAAAMLLARSKELGSSVWTASMLTIHRAEVISILQGIGGPKVTPQVAYDRLSLRFGQMSTAAALEAMIQRPEEVIAILSGIEQPEPISEENAKAMLQAERFANGCDWMDGVIVERRAEVMAILERVR